MPPTVNATVTSMCLFQERQCPFADTSQFGEHGFFVGQQFRLKRDRAFALDNPAFHQRDRQVESIEKRDGQRRFADDAVGVAQNAAFYLAEMPDQLCGGPGAFIGQCAPILGRNGIGRAENQLWIEDWA